MEKGSEKLPGAGRLLGFSVLLLSACVWLAAQSQPPSDSAPQAAGNQSQKDQGVPDAPSAVQPPKPTPEPSPAPPPPSEPPGRSGEPSAQPNPSDHTTVEKPPETPPVATRPPVNIRTVPPGGATQEKAAGQDEYFKLYATTNQVMVPVTVKDDSGHMVEGLTSKDFVILENGKKQDLNFFTSDPFALSAALIIDLGMKDVDLQKVNHTFPALEGAFTDFDELSIYVYGNTVTQLSGWQAVGRQLSATLDQLSRVRGQNNGPPVTSGPLGPQGPIINGVPADPAAPTVYTPVQEAHVLNDAILKAALDLAKRDKSRRKIIFVISDGREYRSNASYRDVLRVLLSNNIMVYAIGVGGPALPGFGKLSKLHIPRLGYTDILPKYVNATTGGEVFNELTRVEIEDAYAEAANEARNQYTMGYLAHLSAPGTFHDIEVLVERPSCKGSSIRPCVNVYAKEGYYSTGAAGVR